VSKQIKVMKTVKPGPSASVDKVQQVWLAGLGAFSIAQKQGKVILDGMINEGRSFQLRTDKLARKVSGEIKAVAETRMAPVKLRLAALRSDAEAKIEQGVGRLMSYAGIPSKADVDSLIARVDKLSRQLRATR